MVEHDLAKVDTGVQFPSPAPVVKNPTELWVFIFFGDTMGIQITFFL